MLKPIRSATLIALCALTVLAATMATAADPADDEREQRRAELLRQMKALAQATEVRFREGEREPQLVAAPVFRYDDQPRRFVDATMWAWIDGGRPVAFEKIEATIFDQPRWGYCFTSVSEQLLDVAWGAERRYRSTEPGITLRPLPEAPPVESRAVARKLQARQLARDFSARITTDPRNNKTEQMRLLSRPIYEYADAGPETLAGAVFGFTTNGTNPDLLVILEARGPSDGVRWHHAAARMTTGGVAVKYHDEVVTEFDFVEPQPRGFPTWTFFGTPREE